MSKDTAAIRDQLGNDPDVTFFLNTDYSESIGIEENSTTISGESLGNSWIVGSPTNGIVGTNLSTEGGGQQVVGSSGRALAIIRVVNPNNIFREHFRDTDFKDSPTTADWDTTNFRIAMTTATSKKRAYTPTVATFKSIFLNQETITKVTIDTDETKWGNDVIKYYFSSDGGREGSWEEVTMGIEHTFKVQGADLRLRIVFSGNGANQTYLENIRISYTTT